MFDYQLLSSLFVTATARYRQNCDSCYDLQGLLPAGGTYGSFWLNLKYFFAACSNKKTLGNSMGYRHPPELSRLLEGFSPPCLAETPSGREFRLALPVYLCYVIYERVLNSLPIGCHGGTCAPIARLKLSPEGRRDYE